MQTCTLSRQVQAVQYRTAPSVLCTARRRSLPQQLCHRGTQRGRICASTPSDHPSGTEGWANARPSLLSRARLVARGDCCIHASLIVRCHRLLQITWHDVGDRSAQCCRGQRHTSNRHGHSRHISALAGVAQLWCAIRSTFKAILRTLKVQLAWAASTACAQLHTDRVEFACSYSLESATEVCS